MPTPSRKRPATWNYSKAAKRVYASRKMSRPFPKLRRRMGKPTVVLNTHRFSRCCPAFTDSISDPEVVTGLSFKLNDVVNHTEFSNLFDRYRLDRIVVTLQLVTNPNSTVQLNSQEAVQVNNSTTPTGWQTNNFYPKVWSYVDHDDADGSTILEMKEKIGAKCRILMPNKVLRYSLRPAIAALAYKTSTTEGYLPKYGQFIDMQNPDLPHYGLHLTYDTNGLDPIHGGFDVRVERKYYFTCKDVR